MNRLHILHVEDDQTDAMITQQILQGSSPTQHYNITQVESLKGALRLLANVHFDAVLLDLHLTDVSGVQNVDAIRCERPEVPVIVLSSYDSDMLALRVIDTGAQEYLVKGHSNGRVIRHAIQSSIRRKAIENQAFRLANYDDVTGLMNQRAFALCAERLLARDNAKANRLMLFEVGEYAKLTQSVSRIKLQKVIKEIAQCCKEMACDRDLLARFDGAQFAFLLDETRPAESLSKELVQKMRAILRAEMPEHITPSVRSALVSPLDNKGGFGALCQRALTQLM